MPKFDPLAPVYRWEVIIELGGRSWMIPAKSAADWAAVVIADRPEFLMDLIEEDADELEEALLAGEVSEFELEEAHREAVAQVSGVRWWEAQRLMLLALDWDATGGELLLRGIRLEERSVAEICVTVWRLITRNLEEKDLNKVRMEIEKPPPGVDYESILDEDANAAALESIPSD